MEVPKKFYKLSFQLEEKRETEKKSFFKQEFLLVLYFKKHQIFWIVVLRWSHSFEGL